MWNIEYENDTGMNDEGFYEWWEISDGNKTFTCDNKDDAIWLRDVLNNSTL